MVPSLRHAAWNKGQQSCCVWSTRKVSIISKTKEDRVAVERVIAGEKKCSLLTSAISNLEKHVDLTAEQKAALAEEQPLAAAFPK